MNKMNKKGFTLIEMLVVIAIIAVLVSIVVPVVSNSTEKASAAANAANLRTVAAQVAIWKLEDTSLTLPLTAASGKITAKVNGVDKSIDAPNAKAVASLGTTANDVIKVEIVGDNIVATYNGKGISDFASVADGTYKAK